ncbi:type II secretion system minor pseudopilin GspI [Escherichia coli]|uniref:type II secretion system minor pseudopilin GspI n=1 Tax=Escherichia coli TaxID=562 RepID=UPI001CD50558|nr:type II secretion system minor pseudopilin GspI [Escherichia coli]HAX3897739.1 type II secretion system minor pseudopilin GspI [Escherichia coli]
MKRGFTLLEVMLALAIFALAATAVLQIASGALSNQHVLEEKTVAGWVAENQTALLQAVDIEVSLHEDFSPVIQSRRAWFSAVGGQQ